MPILLPDVRLITFRAATPNPVSPPQSPRNASVVSSPSTFAVLKDEDLANGGGNDAVNAVDQEEPSAADYDPTMDMREDKLRDDQRHRAEELPSASYDETKAPVQDVLLPASTEVPSTKRKKPRDEFDMFADEDDEDDMFAEQPEAPNAEAETEHTTKAVPVPQPKELDMSMLDDWDDHEGYYRVILGELLDGRYHVQTNLGKGMFSSVVRALDSKTKKLVAIKLIRNNDTM